MVIYETLKIIVTQQAHIKATHNITRLPVLVR